MTQTKQFAYGFVVLAILALVYLMGISQRVPNVEASTITGMDYNATSTAASNVYGAGVNGSKLVRTGTGSLGSYVITGANTGIINFYDATTTDVNLRTGNTATSTILLASFPASVAAGTYVLDVSYSRGLYVDLISGNIATGTITYR